MERDFWLNPFLEVSQVHYCIAPENQFLSYCAHRKKRAMDWDGVYRLIFYYKKPVQGVVKWSCLFLPKSFLILAFCS